VIKEDAIKELAENQLDRQHPGIPECAGTLIILCEKEITGKDVISFAMPISK
jgi:hypothetical protein